MATIPEFSDETAIAPAEEGGAEEDWIEPATPAARLWARLFDIWSLSFLGGIVLGIAFPGLILQLQHLGGAYLLIGLATLPLALLLDAALMALMGTTPGKFLAGIRVETIDGGRVGRKALIRNAHVYVEGLWFGIPFLNLFGMSRARDRLLNEGATSWDEKLGLRVVERGSNELRTIAVAVLAIGLNIGLRVFDKYVEYKQPEWDRAGIVAGLPSMNEGLPHFVDDVTRLDRIDYQPETNMLTLDFTLIHRDGSTVQRSEMADLDKGRQAMLGSYCGPVLKGFRDRNVPVQYRYRYDRGGIAFQTIFHADECGSRT